MKVGLEVKKCPPSTRRVDINSVSMLSRRFIGTLPAYSYGALRDPPPPPPPEKSQKLGFLSNTGPDKGTKPEFNVGLSSARQRNAFKWRFAGVQMMARLYWHLDPSPHKLRRRKNVVKVGPTMTKLSGSTHEQNAVEWRFAGGIVVRFCLLRPGT